MTTEPAPREKVALVVGDVMLDQRLLGQVTRISPEAPVPVLRAGHSLQPAAGGAANVAVNIASLGCRVVLVSAVGDDENGEILRDLLDRTTNLWPWLAVVPNSVTTTKTRLIASGQQLIRVDHEGRLSSIDLLSLLMQAVRTVADQGYDIGAIVISDYAKGLLDPLTLLWIYDLAHVSNAPVYVDAKPDRLPFYRGATVVTPNVQEAVVAASGCVHPALAMSSTDVVAQAEVAGNWLQQQYGYQYVVVTCGGEGAVLIHQGTQQRFPTQAHHVYDVTGAGDTFLAALVVGFLTNVDLVTAITRANVAAGLAVSEPGTVAVTADDWQDALLRLAGAPGKHMTREQVVAFTDRRRRRGQRIVLTNGVFDLLHPGHIWLLQQAQAQGDVLIVACNGDDSVRRLKGSGRPLTPQAMRVQCLTMNTLVDAVVVFEEDTPETLIHAIKPDVLVKGQEHREQAVPGADYVARRGGRVVFVPPYADFSTTAIKARLDAGEQL
jgi:D-beta-D-heptose 7-phosphate kinase/D-beta-D-heptose 1-phosphate adenosyltransferase